MTRFVRAVAEAFDDAGAKLTLGDLMAELTRARHHVGDKANAKLHADAAKHVSRRRKLRAKMNKNLPT